MVILCSPLFLYNLMTIEFECGVYFIFISFFIYTIEACSVVVNTQIKQQDSRTVYSQQVPCISQKKKMHIWGTIIIKTFDFTIDSIYDFTTHRHWRMACTSSTLHN